MIEMFHSHHWRKAVQSLCDNINNTVQKFQFIFKNIFLKGLHNEPLLRQQCD